MPKHASPATSPVCPWWLAWTFDNPLRRAVQDPERILRPLIHPGDTCLDLGCGMGYFTVPLARLVGPTGSVTAVELQPRMLAGVERRARRAGMLTRIRLLTGDAASIALDTPFDFALAFWMLHEVPDPRALLALLATTLRPGARFLLVEPRGHVRRAAFDHTVRIAETLGFVGLGAHRVAFSHTILLARQGSAA